MRKTGKCEGVLKGGEKTSKGDGGHHNLELKREHYQLNVSQEKKRTASSKQPADRLRIRPSLLGKQKFQVRSGKKTELREKGTRPNLLAAKYRIQQKIEKSELGGTVQRRDWGKVDRKRRARKRKEKEFILLQIWQIPKGKKKGWVGKGNEHEYKRASKGKNGGQRERGGVETPSSTPRSEKGKEDE